MDFVSAEINTFVSERQIRFESYTVICKSVHVNGNIIYRCNESITYVNTEEYFNYC